jgi:hypothetical protein
MLETEKKVTLEKGQTLKLYIGQREGLPVYEEFTYEETLPLVARKRHSEARVRDVNSDAISKAISEVSATLWSSDIAETDKGKTFDELNGLLASITAYQQRALSTTARATLYMLVNDEELKATFKTQWETLYQLWRR